jgi:hypothetical protein
LSTWTQWEILISNEGGELPYQLCRMNSL